MDSRATSSKAGSPNGYEAYLSYVAEPWLRPGRSQNSFPGAATKGGVEGLNGTGG